MTQIKKLERKALSWFLALAMVLSTFAGIVPGMSLTAKAAPTETLLTTITPTGIDTYSESTEGVVNVTLSGISTYDNGRWRRSGTVTVTQKEGYTITKCRFITRQSSVDDSEAPFSINVGDYDYVSSIEVYGYANKAAQTITASDVTATYGDTDKSVSASVTTPATGGGAISYTVKDGSEDYIDVASDGKLTIKKVPPTDGKAYVIVKAAATDDYAETTKEVTVTISKAEATVAAKDQSIMVDGTVPDLSAPVLDTHYSVTGLVGTDTLTTAPTLAYEKDGKAATPDSATAGTYDIVPSGASAGDNYNISYTNGTLTISEKQPATVTKAPEAKTLTHTGSAQELVTAGTATGGEMQYALGTATEATEAYSTSIPTKTDAGTYYVWYKAVGDASHSDSEPGVVKVEIAKDDAAVDAVKKKIDALPASDKVTVNDKKAIEDARAAYDKLTDEQKKQIPAETVKKLEDVEKALAAAEAAEKAAKALAAAKKEAQAAMNEQVTVTQKGNKFTVKWKKSKSADGYYVYAQYCGKKFKKPVKTIKKNTTTKVTIKKINGKKLNLKKQFRVYVVPYKIIDGKKVKLGKSMVDHVVGSKNTKYSNVKKLTLKKKKYTIKVGKTAKIKAKITLVNKNKKHIPKGHGAKFRYKSSDTSIATVSKNGKIKGIKKGKCTIYVYSINGLTKKAKITVK